MVKSLSYLIAVTMVVHYTMGWLVFNTLTAMLDLMENDTKSMIMVQYIVSHTKSNHRMYK